MSSARKKGPRFVVTGKAGQLGNRLFFFSYVLSLAAKLGGTVANPGFADFAAHFEGTSRDFLSRWPARVSMLRARWLGEMACRIVNFAVRLATRVCPSFFGIKILVVREDRSADFRLDHPEFLHSLRDARTVFIGGWLELKHLRFEQPEILRAHFAPVERHRDAVARLISDARAKCDVLIGVHIRQGDYAGFLDGRYFFPTAIYVRAMHAAAALFPGRRVGFLVCSDQPQQIPEPAFACVASGTGDVIEDLHALAKCDWLIGPPSTFSLWASFFGKVPLWEMHDATSAPQLAEFLLRF